MKYASVGSSRSVPWFPDAQEGLLTELDQPSDHVDGHHEAPDDAHARLAHLQALCILPALETRSQSLLGRLPEDAVDGESARGDAEAYHPSASFSMHRLQKLERHAPK